jgi:hypothetical protein
MGIMHVTGYAEPVESSVASFVTNLPETLGAMFVDPRCVVAIVEFTDGRYVQFWAEPDGLLISEVVSNLNISAAGTLSVEEEEQLRRSGWLEPNSASSPNWRYDARDAGGLIQSVRMVREAVLEVLRERPGNAVSMRSWVMRRDPETTAQDLREQARVRYQESLRDIEAQLGDD